MNILVKHRSPGDYENMACHPVLAKLFSQRGIRQLEEVDYKLQHLLPPNSLYKIEDASQLLINSIRNNDTIVIVADYDCDGATACAVAIRGLKLLGKQCNPNYDTRKLNYLVPNRLIHGYGLTPVLVDLAQERFSPQLLITVDNGIASVEGVKRAQELGIKVLITDHHLPGRELPAAQVIVNPNLSFCHFPSKNLAGVGVIFYILLAMRSALRQEGLFNQSQQPNLAQLLDLVALGTIADIVKLDYNNRILVAQGLANIRRGYCHPGITALLFISGHSLDEVKTSHLSFGVGPRINAAGRLQDMSLGIECLLTDDVGHALSMAHELDKINIDRRKIEGEMRTQAEDIINSLLIDDKKSICLFHPEWHPGVIGIVASRLKERYHRPTLAFAFADYQGIGQKQLRASGRSIENFHLRDGLDLISKQAPDLIKTFGGHAMAAGLSLDIDKFEPFKIAFENVVAASNLSSSRIWECDGELENAYHNIEVTQMIDQQVWGHTFPPPLFYGEFHILEQKLLKERHLKMLLQKGNDTFQAIWFQHDTFIESPIGALYQLHINTFNGTSTVQILIENAAPVRDFSWI